MKAELYVDGAIYASMTGVEVCFMGCLRKNNVIVIAIKFSKILLNSCKLTDSVLIIVFVKC